MPLDKSSNESNKQSICDYITKADIFFSTHPTTANRWCLGIHAENSEDAKAIRDLLCHSDPFINPAHFKLENDTAFPWCNGKYNVVIATLYSQSELEQIKNTFANC